MKRPGGGGKTKQLSQRTTRTSCRQSAEQGGICLDKNTSYFTSSVKKWTGHQWLREEENWLFSWTHRTNRKRAVCWVALSGNYGRGGGSHHWHISPPSRWEEGTLGVCKLWNPPKKCSFTFLAATGRLASHERYRFPRYRARGSKTTSTANVRAAKTAQKVRLP